MPKKHNKKRLNTAGVFGILNILIGISGLLILVQSSILNGSLLMLSSSVLSTIFRVYFWVMSLVLIVIGIGLLKSKRWARKSMIYTSAVIILVNLIDGITQIVSASSSTYLMVLPSLIYSFVMMSIYYALAIWYFTHQQ